MANKEHEKGQNDRKNMANKEHEKSQKENGQ